MMAVAVMLAGCGKPELPVEMRSEIKNDTVEVYAERAVFRWEVDYPGKVGSVVELGTDGELTDAVRYGDEQVSDKKQFEVEVDSLVDGKRYYYRHVVWNSFNRYETEVHRFTTLSLYAPTVTTDSVTGVGHTTAECHGAVTADGGAEVTVRGFCYALHDIPTTADSVFALRASW